MDRAHSPLRLLAVCVFALAAACGNRAAEPGTTSPTPAPPPDGAVTCVRSGCSGTLCVPQGQEVVTTCEYKPEYDCYQEATCAWQPSNQTCGWNEPDQIDACVTLARERSEQQGEPSER